MWTAEKNSIAIPRSIEELVRDCGSPRTWAGPVGMERKPASIGGRILFFPRAGRPSFMSSSNHCQRLPKMSGGGVVFHNPIDHVNLHVPCSSPVSFSHGQFLETNRRAALKLRRCRSSKTSRKSGQTINLYAKDSEGRSSQRSTLGGSPLRLSGMMRLVVERRPLHEGIPQPPIESQFQQCEQEQTVLKCQKKRKKVPRALESSDNHSA